MGDYTVLEWHPIRSNPIDFLGSDAPRLRDFENKPVSILYIGSDYWVQFGDEQPQYGGGCTSTCYLLNLREVGLVGRDLPSKQEVKHE